MQRENEENDFSDFVQDPPAATVIEAAIQKELGTIGAKQLDDLLDKSRKEFDDKWNPVINSMNISLAQQKETLRKLSQPTNSAPVLYGQTSLVPFGPCPFVHIQ